jgi:hypothetical protein
MRRLLLPLVLLALLPAGAAQAEPFPVTNTKDDEGSGSLRASIEEANKNSGGDTIPINVTGTIHLATPLPTIAGNVSIIGPGPGSLTVRRSALGGFRIFDIGSGATAVSISGLTVTNGLASAGGGINNSFGTLTVTDTVVTDNDVVVASAGVGSSARGGGIASFGPLTVRESVVSDNVARASDGSTATSARGAGISAFGTLVVDRSTISGNFALAEIAGTAVEARGAGVDGRGESTTIERSTISGNTADASGGGVATSAGGGGIEVAEGTISLTGSTITGNSVASSGSALGANLEISDANLVRDTIVADPIGAESCGSPLTSGGFNLDEDGSCEFDKGTDLTAVSAGLAPLADNGGPTPTHALLPGGGAIDRGFSFAFASDQRNLPRPSNFISVSDTEGGDGSDIGAFELQAPPLPPPAPLRVSEVPADTQAPNTRIVSGPARITFKRLAKFRFASTEAQSSFQCKVDKGRWRECRNPFKRKVGAGAKHVFKVRAIDRFGNVDPTPARFGWRVKAIGG